MYSEHKRRRRFLSGGAGDIPKEEKQVSRKKVIWAEGTFWSFLSSSSWSCWTWLSGSKLALNGVFLGQHTKSLGGWSFSSAKRRKYTRFAFRWRASAGYLISYCFPLLGWLDDKGLVGSRCISQSINRQSTHGQQQHPAPDRQRLARLGASFFPSCVPDVVQHVEFFCASESIPLPLPMSHFSFLAGGYKANFSMQKAGHLAHVE